MKDQTKKEFEAIYNNSGVYWELSNVHNDMIFDLMKAAYNLALIDASEAARINMNSEEVGASIAVCSFRSGTTFLSIDQMSILNLQIS